MIQYTIANWAHRHTSAAIAIIIMLEVASGYLGTLLGANLLEEVPAGILQASLIALIGLVIYVRLWYLGAEPTLKIRRRQVRQVCMGVLFVGNFLLFTLLSGIGANRVR